MTDDAENRTSTSKATQRADRTDAQATHDADRPPTDEEADRAPTEVSESVAADHRKANERGANVRGEGRID